jgi:stage IV sporulation protein FB
MLIIFLVSILFHELGHIFACKILHKNFGKIKFGIYGFSNETLELSALKCYQKIFILSSGVIVNLLISIVSCRFQNRICLEFGYINLLLAIFNLLPIIPLDGGNILICLLKTKLEFKKSISIALNLSKALLILTSFLYCIAIIYLKNVFLLGLIIYMWYIFLKEEKQFEIFFEIERKILLQ